MSRNRYNNLTVQIERTIQRVTENIRTNNRRAQKLGVAGRRSLVNNLRAPRPIIINPVFLDRAVVDEFETDLDIP